MKPNEKLKFRIAEQGRGLARLKLHEVAGALGKVRA